MARQRKASKHIVGHSAAGVADHERFTEMQTEGSKHVNACVHARDHRETAAGAGVSDVRTGGGVPLVRVKKLDDLRHADLARRSAAVRANAGDDRLWLSLETTAPVANATGEQQHDQEND